MGKLINGIHGPFSGKLGNVVGTFWKGISVIRVIPAQNTDPKTALQQLQRDKVKVLSSFMHECKALINIGFAALDPKKSTFNHAMRHNLTETVEGSFPDFRINVEKIRLSMGKLLNVKDPVILKPDDQTIRISWTDNSNNETAFPNDQLHLCVIDGETLKVHIPKVPVSRDACTCLITPPSDWKGDHVYVIGFMAKKATKDWKLLKGVSNSQVWRL